MSSAWRNSNLSEKALPFLTGDNLPGRGEKVVALEELIR
jgi:hypothetical protein